MVNCQTFATKARYGGYIGIPYATLDCQGYVKRVCHDLGENVTWRGSNDMWRNKTTDNREIKTRSPTAGELVFIVKKDGKEPKYYTDGVNASHVGIYTGDGVMESTTGGVQYHDGLPSKWTHCAKLNCVNYDYLDEDSDNRDYVNGYNMGLADAIAALERMKKL